MEWLDLCLQSSSMHCSGMDPPSLRLWIARPIRMRSGSSEPSEMTSDNAIDHFDGGRFVPMAWDDPMGSQHATIRLLETLVDDG